MYHQNITHSPTFCPAPWTSLNINQLGLVMPCMHSGFCLGNIKQKNIFEILQDQPLQSMKQAQARGEWHQACQECENREKYSVSPRQQWHTEPEVLAEIQKDLNSFFRPEHLTLNWSNLCNLACTYCNAETSTAWQSYKKIPISYIRNEHQALIELVSKNRGSLRGLTLGGGEPLLQKGLVDLLQVMEPTTTVVVTTNLSVDIRHNEIYQILKTWPHVDWMISFDNVTAKQFEYVRHGADWLQFCDNIKTMQADDQSIIAHPAYSIYCALDLESYYQWCEQQNLPVFWCDLIHPPALDVRRMNHSIRQRAVEQIDSVIQKFPGLAQTSLHTLDRYRQQLVDNSYLSRMEWQPNDADLAQFCSGIELELNKTTRFADLWPHVWKLL